MSDRAESPYSWGAAVAEHEAIVRALESRDPLAAAAAMSGHLHASHGRWLAEPLPGGKTPRKTTRSCSSPAHGSGRTRRRHPLRHAAPRRARRLARAHRRESRQVLPRSHQVDWMRLERTFFLHFGVNTFNEVEWGSGRGAFALQPQQPRWGSGCAASKLLDGKMLVLVAKHHDGFSMWPTRYTAPLQRTPLHLALARQRATWCARVSNAAREAGVKFAVYLSPADLYQLKTNPRTRRPITATAAPSAPPPSPLTRRTSAPTRSAAARPQRLWRLPLRGR